MKKMGTMALVAMIIMAIVSGCGKNNQETTEPNSQGSTPIKFVVGHTGTEGNSVYVFFHTLKEEVEKRSNGQLQLTVHDAGALGGDNQLVDGLRTGSIDIASSASSNMATYTKDLLILDLPYIFKSRESAQKVLNGEIGNELLQKTSETAGTKALAFFDVGGFRLLANTEKEVKTPDDIKGLKLRTTKSPIEVELTKAWGANPTPVDWAETYTALEQKVVEGLQLQPVWLALNGFGEVVKYATKVKALMAFHVVQFNKDKWDSLTPEQRKIFEESIKVAQQVANQADAEGEANYIKQLEDKGVKIYEPTEDELKQWQDIGLEVQKRFSEQVDQALVDKIIQAQN